MPSRSLGELVVDLEARTSKMEASLDRAGRQLKKTRKSFVKEADLIKRAFIGLVSVEALRRGATAIIRTADQMTQLRGRVQNATKATGDFQKVWQQLGTIASSTGTELQTTVEVFQRLTIARAELNATNSQLLKFTKSVQQLGIISGASTGAMSAGLTQLGQGLSAGVLRAEEFNSIVENIPAVAQAIAKGMGLTVGQLRAAVLEGRVLSRDVLDSILSQTGDIAAQTAEMPGTIQRAASEFRTEFALLIDRLNESLGLTRLIAAALSSMADDIRRNFAEGENGIDRIYRRIKELETIPNAGNIIASVLGLDFAEGEELKGLRDVAAFLEAARQSAERLSGAHDTLAGSTKGVAGAMDDKNKKLTAQEKAIKKDIEAAADASIKYGDWADSLAEANEEFELYNKLTNEQNTNYWTEEVRKAQEGWDVWAESVAEVSRELEEQQQVFERYAVFWDEAQRNIQDATGTAVYDTLFGKGDAKRVAAKEFGAAMDELEKQLNRGVISTEEFEKEREKLHIEYTDKLAGIDKKYGDTFKQWTGTILDAWKNMIAEMIAAWLNSGIIGLITGQGLSGFKIPGIGTGAGIGAAATSSGAGGALAGTIAAGGGTALVATTAVGGPIAAGQAAAFGVTSAGAPVPVSIASVSSGAGSAIVGSGIGGLAGAGLAFGPVLAAIALSGTRRTPAQGLQRLQSSGQTEQFSRRGGLALGGAELDPLAAFLEGSGAGVSKVPGLGITAFQSGREDEFEGIGELVKKFRELQELMPELQETAATTFESMDIGADDLAASFLDDGVLGAVESAQLGFVGLGDVSADQFQRIAAAVDSGAIRIEALRGEVEYTEEELGLLGVIGAKSMRDLANETGKTDEQLLRMKETARETLRETGDGFARASREADGAAESVQRLGDEIRSLPAVPIGGGEGRHSGGSFDVRHSGGSFQVSGRPGVDANLVQFMATAGERVRVETPGTTQHQTQHAGPDDVLTSRLDRLITLMEAA